MKFLKLAAAVVTLSFGLGLIAESTEAARLGGGRSLGTQRSVTQRQATPPQSAQQAAPAAQAPAAAGGNRWLGPLAGLAAGLGLGWLFANGGLGGFGSILLVIAAAFVIMMVVRALLRPKMANGMRQQPMQYAGLGNETVAAPPPSQLTGGDASWGRPQPAAAQPAIPAIPAGFDVAGFVKQAKLNFIRLQEANDRGDLEALREVTTDDLYEKLAADIRDRAGAPQHTDVVTLDGSLLEVVTEDAAHWASVRFSGQIRESAGAAAVPFGEVWHLTKPVQGGGWLVAGIEQIS